MTASQATLRVVRGGGGRGESTREWFLSHKRMVLGCVSPRDQELTKILLAPGDNECLPRDSAARSSAGGGIRSCCLVSKVGTADPRRTHCGESFDLDAPRSHRCPLLSLGGVGAGGPEAVRGGGRRLRRSGAAGGDRLHQPRAGAAWSSF